MSDEELISKIRVARTAVRRHFFTEGASKSLGRKYSVTNTDQILEILGMQNTLGSALYVRDMIANEEASDDDCFYQLENQIRLHNLLHS